MYKRSIKIRNSVTILQFEVNFQALVTYIWEIFQKCRKYAVRTPERKKIRKFSLKTAQAKKKNKKKTGSNVEKLRKLEPQQKQRVLIKKKRV